MNESSLPKIELNDDYIDLRSLDRPQKNRKTNSTWRSQNSQGSSNKIKNTELQKLISAFHKKHSKIKLSKSNRTLEKSERPTSSKPSSNVEEMTENTGNMIESLPEEEAVDEEVPDPQDEKEDEIIPTLTEEQCIEALTNIVNKNCRKFTDKNPVIYPSTPPASKYKKTWTLSSFPIPHNQYRQENYLSNQIDRMTYRYDAGDDVNTTIMEDASSNASFYSVASFLNVIFILGSLCGVVLVAAALSVTEQFQKTSRAPSGAQFLLNVFYPDLVDDSKDLSSGIIDILLYPVFKIARVIKSYV